MVPTSTNLPLATENQHATGCAKTRRSLHGTLSTPKPKGLSEQNSLGKETNQGMNLPAEREQDQDVLGYVTTQRNRSAQRQRQRFANPGL